MGVLQGVSQGLALTMFLPPPFLFLLALPSRDRNKNRDRDRAYPLFASFFFLLFFLPSFLLRPPLKCSLFPPDGRYPAAAWSSDIVITRPADVVLLATSPWSPFIQSLYLQGSDKSRFCWCQPAGLRSLLVIWSVVSLFFFFHPMSRVPCPVSLILSLMTSSHFLSNEALPNFIPRKKKEKRVGTCK